MTSEHFASSSRVVNLISMALALFRTESDQRINVPIRTNTQRFCLGSLPGQGLFITPEPDKSLLNLHERIENKLFLDRTRKDSNFKRPHICATLFQIEKCWSTTRRWPRTARSASGQIGLHHRMDLFALAAASAQPPD